MLVILTALAWAGNSYDAHGFNAVVQDGDAGDLLTVWRPELQVSGSFGVSGLGEYADELLVQMSSQDGVVSSTPWLDNLYGVNLGLFYAFHRRAAVGLSAPVWVSSLGPNGTEGVALGDMRLAAPLGVLLPSARSGGPALSVVPFVDLPTGAAERYLGNGRFGGGGLVAGGWSRGPWAVAANVGISARPDPDLLNLTGGLGSIVGLGGSFRWDNYHAVRLESALYPDLSPNTISGAESPGELLLSVRGRYHSGLSWTAGGATAVTAGASAAALRVFVGVGWSNKPLGVDSDEDGIVDGEDKCPDVAEAINGYADTDGCFDQLAALRVLVRDPDGGPVPYAQVVVDGVTIKASVTGEAPFADLTPGHAPTVTVSASGFKEQVRQDFELDEGSNEWPIQLDYLPSPVSLIVQAEDKKPIDATIQFQGSLTIPAINTGWDGETHIELPPGEWRLGFSATGYGTTSRRVVVSPGTPLNVAVQLGPELAVMEDDRITIRQQVRFAFNAATIDPSSNALLDQVADLLLLNPDIRRVEVGGHTDNVGSEAFNLDLSQRRVDAVVAALVARGVEPERLTPVGYGEMRPQATNETESGRAQNRRVEFLIREKK